MMDEIDSPQENYSGVTQKSRTVIVSRQQLTMHSTEKNSSREPTKNDADTMRRTGSHSNQDINEVLR